MALDTLTEPTQVPADTLAQAEHASQQGQHLQGARLARQAAEAAESAGDTHQAASAYALLALQQARLGEFEAAVTSGQRALRDLSSAEQAPLESRANCALSLAYEGAGMNPLAVKHAAAALEAARACGDLAGQCWALNRMGTAMDDPDGEHRGHDMLA